jgi:subtilisin family serine protease
MQLSGTSMAAGVVSGTVALLLEQRERLTPRDAKAVLQMTSSFMPGVGLVASGAGSLNALAAVLFVESERLLRFQKTTISGEIVSQRGLAFTSSEPRDVHAQVSRISSRRRSRWTSTLGAWSSDDTIIWGTSHLRILTAPDTIIWGTSDTIIWGTNDTAVSVSGNTIIWGTNSADTIIWGTAAGEGELE